MRESVSAEIEVVSESVDGIFASFFPLAQPAKNKTKNPSNKSEYYFIRAAINVNVDQILEFLSEETKLHSATTSPLSVALEASTIRA